jgi:hypothetical protein
MSYILRILAIAGLMTSFAVADAAFGASRNKEMPRESCTDNC